ncbi:S8 family serine peptidase [Pontiellaceae bacterium B1224]|nr:S8 family serine peptidase [Pontiellaceae bacterium B1224]
MKKLCVAFFAVVSVTVAEGLESDASVSTNVVIKGGITNGYTKAMSERDRKSMSDARRKRKDILSKRHNLKDKQTRADVVRQLKEMNDAHEAAVRRRAKALGLELEGDKPNGGRFRLVDFDDDGFPVYEETMNVDAAMTTAADEVRSNPTYLGVNGSSVTIGLWEAGGIPRVTHQELTGHVTVMDGSTSTSDHATHTAGTLVSRGVNAATLGMAPGAHISAFSSTSDEAEMMAYGAFEPNSTNLYLSNHSYGSTKGWKYQGSNNGTNDWSYSGTFSDDGDPSNDYVDDFGRYDNSTEEWDGIAYNLPYYLIFVSAGNSRTVAPSNGDTWSYKWKDYIYDSTKHPMGNRYYKDGWDNMEGKSLAKNVISVGWADEGISNGIRDASKATADLNSSRGPVDDGRIKPDVYGNGSGLRSCIDNSDTATASYSGTSMSSPNVCGSAALLIDYYTSRFPGQAMRASTLKALIIHTADDRWIAGPDYKYGWGIMNTQAAADVIKAHADNQGGGTLLESLVDTTITSRTHTFGWDGSTALRVTLCWTDPPRSEIDEHDSREKALVNDLNLSVVGPDGTHYPYVMPHVGDWSIASIDDKAITGVNDVDNVEQVYLSSPVAGEYTVSVDYVGSLTDNEQHYSLVVTGQNGLEFSEMEVWRAEHFGTTNVTGDMADDADYDGDGFANLLEFGLATLPTVSNADPVVFTIDPTDAMLSYPRNLSATNEYDFEMVWSDNLMSNSWSTLGVLEDILSTDGSVQQVESTLPLGDSTNRYFQLRIKKKQEK